MTNLAGSRQGEERGGGSELTKMLTSGRSRKPKSAIGLFAQKTERNEILHVAALFCPPEAGKVEKKKKEDLTHTSETRRLCSETFKWHCRSKEGGEKRKTPSHSDEKRETSAPSPFLTKNLDGSYRVRAAGKKIAKNVKEENFVASFKLPRMRRRKKEGNIPIFYSH